MKIDVNYAEALMERLSRELRQTLVWEQIGSRIVELLNENPCMSADEVLTKLATEPEPLEDLDALVEERKPALEAERDESLANYQLVISLTEIQSVSFFDEGVYEDYEGEFSFSSSVTNGSRRWPVL